MSHIIAGCEGWEHHQYGSGSAADMLANAKLIVIWGFDPALGSSGPGYQFAWFLKLARERGKRVIMFDPRYTVGAEVLADQWIPIKPGTDHAMFLAMAFVLFKEDLWDKPFVARYLEPRGFETWKNYVLGIEDGIPKTPGWAERQCAVPAQTIHELAKLAATTRPTWLCCHWGVMRKSHGEQTIKSFAALQAMLGYWGMAGAGPAIHIGPTRPIPYQAPWGPPGDYHVPKMYRSHQWAQAVLLLDKVRSKDLSEQDYMRMVGWRADPDLVREFNPKVLLWGGGQGPHASDHLVTACESPNFQVEAINRMKFVATTHSIMTATASYADIILPARDWMWEEKSIAKGGGYGGFESINYCPGVVEPEGDTRPWVWIYTKLAQKLGVDPQKFFRYYTTDENWDNDWERYLADSYQGIVDYYRTRNIAVPSWDEFTNGKFINCDELEERPFVGWDEQIRQGKPFKTLSGKIEIGSPYLADESNRGKGEHYDYAGRLYANLPSDWGPLTATPVYRKAVRGMDDPMTRQYPLLQLAPHSRYRVHYLFWEHLWLKGQLYRHNVWLSTTDAKNRGVRDGDLVTVYNDRGRIVMPAYVTSRIMPGVVAIHHGGKYIPDEAGNDRGASPSTTLGGDFESCITPAKASTLVQVERYQQAADARGVAQGR
jgi:anaerobic dimethyl sulfoxide reductase subunit A